MVRRVLLLAPTTSYQVDDLRAAAARLGVDALVGTDRCHVLAEDWPQGDVPLDFRDPERAAEQVLAAAAPRGLDGVVATDEVTALIAGLVAARAGLRHAGPAAALAAADKRRFREAARAAGLPHPRYAIVAPGEDPAVAAGTIGYPVVLKPLHLSASRGVMRADDADELAACAARLRRLLDDPAVAVRAADPGAARHLLVEEFLPGPEVALEGLLDGGRLHTLAIFDKPDPLDGPFFAETLYVTPSELPTARQDAIATAVADAARSIGLAEGPVHAELRLGAGAAVVIELAARSIGGLCGRALRFGAGISLEEVVIAHAVGIDPGALTRSGHPASGVAMLPVDRAGVLIAVNGVDEARTVSNVREVVISARSGDVLVPLPEGHAYLGFIFAAGGSPAEVTAALRSARARLDFAVAPRL
ncbi:MAG TPA: ATP-grasp domain-containing protein [Kofleriaceae bacterium]|nr:ATP-grasp domain-containing protein [Kofleriaceae bacterium]